MINPSYLRIKGFQPKHYMLFWEVLIREIIDKIYFNKNWQFSDGCFFEYVLASKLHIKKYFVAGTMHNENPAILIRKAYDWMKDRDVLTKTYARIYRIFTDECLNEETK